MSENRQSSGELRTRQARLAVSGPATVDEAARSVGVVVATETPVVEFDRERYEMVPTVLLMAGCELPASGQLVLLDNHNRFGEVAANVRGSVRGLSIAGDTLRGTAFFAESAGEEWNLLVAGHLTDVSVGRTDLESEYLSKGQTATIGGRAFTGPIRVVTKWQPKEVSLVPVGADPAAKVRSQYHKEGSVRMETNNNQVEPVANDVLRQAAIDAHLHVRNEALGFDAGTIARLRNLRSVAEVDNAIFAEIAARQTAPANQSFGPSLTAGATRDEKHAGAISTALTMRSLSQLGEAATNKALPANCRAVGWESYRNRPLREIARACLESAGVDCRNLSEAEIAQAALFPGRNAGGWPTRGSVAYHTPSAFPNILLDAASKTLTAAFELEENLSWRQVARVGPSVRDFKQTHRVALGDLPNLPTWDGWSEPQEISTADNRVSFAVEAHYAKLSLSWKTIVNDELDAFSRLVVRLGLAAARTVNATFINALTANPTMPDGQRLFLTAPTGLRYKSNQTAGSGVPSVSTVGALMAKMRLQPGLNTPEGAQSQATLNIRPKFLLVPASLETTAMQLVNSIADPAASGNSGVFNPFKGLEVVVDANLDSKSSTAWYLLADPFLYDTIEVNFLQGQETPVIRSWTDDETLALNYSVLQSFAPTILDFRGMARHLGAAE